MRVEREGETERASDKNAENDCTAITQMPLDRLWFPICRFRIDLECSQRQRFPLFTFGCVCVRVLEAIRFLMATMATTFLRKYFTFSSTQIPPWHMPFFALLHISKTPKMPNFIIIHLFICFHLLCFVIVLIFVSILFGFLLSGRRMWIVRNQMKRLEKINKWWLILAYTYESDATFAVGSIVWDVRGCLVHVLSPITVVSACVFIFLKVRILVKTTIKTKRNACMCAC